MCMFSNAVAYVGGTRIFARRVSPQRQTLVYQMEVALDKPVAMILPLPVLLPANEQDVHFVSIQKYEFFFDDVARLFPQRGRAMAGGAPMPSVTAMASAPPLIVREIGDFVASFVPSQADFGRLDPRFVLGPSIWKQLPQYRDYGFAVFQLKAPDKIRKEAREVREGGGVVSRPGFGGRSPSEGLRVQVHPMAFSFATRYPDRLYFPTVHVHDRQVHPQEEFDHTLYAQPAPRQRRAAVERGEGWQAGAYQPGGIVRMDLIKGMVADQGTVLKRDVIGMHKNEDIWIPG